MDWNQLIQDTEDVHRRRTDKVTTQASAAAAHCTHTHTDKDELTSRVKSRDQFHSIDKQSITVHIVKVVNSGKKRDSGASEIENPFLNLQSSFSFRPLAQKSGCCGI